MNKTFEYQWGTRIKVPIENSYGLSLVYTPGVATSCLEIKDKPQKAFELTNRGSNIAVIGLEHYDKLVQHSIKLKLEKNMDGFPLLISTKDSEKIIKIIKNLIPTFCGFDLSLMPQNIQNEIKSELKNSNTYFLCSEYDFNVLPNPQKVDSNEIKAILKDETGDIKENSIKLHSIARGVVETYVIKTTETAIIKPIAVISDGSAVLGLGNIGAESAMPVMEGKAALFKALGEVDAIPICLQTQDSAELIEIISLLAGSFSGINLEDISAPRCFDIENALIEKLNIPLMHDDRHGTAMVVKAGLLNALKVANKELDKIKIVISGAGAAAQTVAESLLDEGAIDITLSDINGIVYIGREKNDCYLEKIARKTNPEGIKGTLKDAIKDADVFIGLSAPNVLTSEMIKTMNFQPIVFALANPNPEILPNLAKEAGAFIVATGRSDFANQINNSLAFPGVFKGAIKNKITKITPQLKSAASKAIAAMIKPEELSVENIIPHALDKSVPEAISNAFAQLKD